MNVLGFVSFILLVFWIGYYSIFHHGLFIDSVSRSGSGYFIAQKHIQNQFTEKALKDSIGKVTYPPLKPQPTTKTLEKPLPKKRYKKDTFCPCCSINISFLRHKKNLTQEPSYQLLRQILERLYAPLFEEISVDPFLQAWIQAIQALPYDTPLCWENIAFKEKDMQQLFYQMVQGTKFYEKGKVGYPPLAALVNFEKPTSICLPCISKELLEIMVGKDQAQKLWAKKQEDKELLSFSKEELSLEFGSQIPYEDFFVFTHKGQQEEMWISGRDEATEVEIKVPKLSNNRTIRGKS